ncbi:hypothetical protein LAZ67_10003015 [Cordylochernes scorpioides]|uniref:Transposase n=1 Tax=Cordylochernes scorpioides TaxID=51811 RepID=A0ABY6L0D3_9ARAC|nr:hypothetical protein LAZ67_10003015 [Cordylochernes scorpioides]
MDKTPPSPYRYCDVQHCFPFCLDHDCLYSVALLKVSQGAERYWKTLHALTVPLGYYRVICGFVYLTRKQRHLATEIGCPTPCRENVIVRLPDGQSKYPPTNRRGRGVKRSWRAGAELVTQLCQVGKKKASRGLAQDDLRELHLKLAEFLLKMILGKNAQNVQKITDLIKENPRTTLLELEPDTGISKTTIGRIVTKDLKLKKTPAKFIPRFLTNEQKLCRLATCENMLEMTRTDPEWKDKIITGDETWVYDYDLETKRQYAEWRGQEWSEIVFTEESRFCLQHHDGRIRVWRHRGERMLNSCVMHRHTGPAPGIIVWGNIGYHSRTPLVRIAGTLNSQRYISEVLEPIVPHYLQGLPTAIFQ